MMLRKFKSLRNCKKTGKIYSRVNGILHDHLPQQKKMTAFKVLQKSLTLGTEIYT